MSLTYELKDIKNFQALCFKDDPEDSEQQLMQRTTYNLIWLSMPCGYGEITKKNAKLVFQRINLYERTFGAWGRNRVDGKTVDVFITYKDVLNHIGLTTNVITESEAVFKKTIINRLINDRYRAAKTEIQIHESGDKGE